MFVPDGVLGPLFGMVQPNGDVAIGVSVTVEHSTDQSMSFQGEMISVTTCLGTTLCSKITKFCIRDFGLLTDIC